MPPENTDKIASRFIPEIYLGKVPGISTGISPKIPSTVFSRISPKSFAEILKIYHVNYLRNFLWNFLFWISSKGFYKVFFLEFLWKFQQQFQQESFYKFPQQFLQKKTPIIPLFITPRIPQEVYRIPYKFRREFCKVQWFR